MGLKKNNPGCGCCSEGGVSCAQCSGDTPQEVTLEVSGITSNNCDCSMIDGTYILTQSSVNPCNYSSGTFPFDTSCYYGSCRGATYGFSLNLFATSINLIVTIYYSGWTCPQGISQRIALASAPYDCTIARSFTWLGDGDAATYPCSGWSTATMEVSVA